MEMSFEMMRMLEVQQTYLITRIVMTWLLPCVNSWTEVYMVLIQARYRKNPPMILSQRGYLQATLVKIST